MKWTCTGLLGYFVKDLTAMITTLVAVIYILCVKTIQMCSGPNEEKSQIDLLICRSPLGQVYNFCEFRIPRGNRYIIKCLAGIVETFFMLTCSRINRDLNRMPTLN